MDHQGTNPPVFYSLWLCNSSSELQVQPVDCCSGSTSAQEDALKLITDVTFGHSAVVALQAIYPFQNQRSCPKPKQDSSFPSASLQSGLPQAPPFSPSCCSSLSLGLPGLQEPFPCSGLTGMPSNLLHLLGGQPPPALWLVSPSSPRDEFLQSIKILKKSTNQRSFPGAAWGYSHSPEAADGCPEGLVVLPPAEWHQKHSRTRVGIGANSRSRGTAVPIDI